MAKAIRNHLSTPAPQSEPESEIQVKNNAGGYTFEVSDKVRLERFLILGVDGGTYYVSEKDLTKQNVDFLRKLIKKDENLVLQTTVAISKSGRAYRNDAAVFVMALLLSEGKNKKATVSAIPSVVRTGTHVYALADYITSLGGWGRSKRAAVAGWFKSQSVDQLAYQAVKYRQRNGWTLRDLMRKSHVTGIDKNVGNFILGKPTLSHGVEIIDGFEAMQESQSVSSVLERLDSYPNLPWETIPTKFLTDFKVWKKLFENGQLRGQAALRNVIRLAKLGAFEDMGFARKFSDLIADENMIKATRLHPMNYLNAYVVFNEGQAVSAGWSVARTRAWNVSPIVTSALYDGFGISFENIEPANKKTMISIDTSASMGWNLAGNTQLDCYQGAAAMAMITARTEPMYVVNGFATRLKPINISSRNSLADAIRMVRAAGGGGTDCAQPMLHAIEKNLDIDTFIVITDNETWAGNIHPHKALEQYRQKSGNAARLVVVAMTPTNYTIANPLDVGMLDVVGFDSNTPKVIADFSAGRI